MVQRVKAVALSLQRLGSLLWFGFKPWPGERSHAVGVAKKKKRQSLAEGPKCGESLPRGTGTQTHRERHSHTGSCTLSPVTSN